jgi:hypothetical protein
VIWCRKPYQSSDIKKSKKFRINLGITIEGVTCDGLRNILRAVHKSSPHTVIQRCLAHIQRESLQWLTKHPQSQAGYELKDIIKRLHTIDNRDKWGYWVVDVVKWYERHESFVNVPLSR